MLARYRSPGRYRHFAKCELKKLTYFGTLPPCLRGSVLAQTRYVIADHWEVIAVVMHHVRGELGLPGCRSGESLEGN